MEEPTIFEFDSYVTFPPEGMEEEQRNVILVGSGLDGARGVEFAPGGEPNVSFHPPRFFRVRRPAEGEFRDYLLGISLQTRERPGAEKRGEVDRVTIRISFNVGDPIEKEITIIYNDDTPERRHRR